MVGGQYPDIDPGLIDDRHIQQLDDHPSHLHRDAGDKVHAVLQGGHQGIFRKNTEKFKIAAHLFHPASASYRGIPLQAAPPHNVPQAGKEEDPSDLESDPHADTLPPEPSVDDVHRELGRIAEGQQIYQYLHHPAEDIQREDAAARHRQHDADGAE